MKKTEEDLRKHQLRVQELEKNFEQLSFVVISTNKLLKDVNLKLNNSSNMQMELAGDIIILHETLKDIIGPTTDSSWGFFDLNINNDDDILN